MLAVTPGRTVTSICLSFYRTSSNKRMAAVAIRRALADLPVCKDIVVTTPEEITRRGDLIGTVLRPALREGKVLYERS